MVEFLREHFVLSMLGAYVLGQVTIVLVLGGLLPRDPADANLEQPDRARVDARNRGRRPHRPRRLSGGYSLRALTRPLMGGRLGELEEEPVARLN